MRLSSGTRPCHGASGCLFALGGARMVGSAKARTGTTDERSPSSCDRRGLKISGLVHPWKLARPKGFEPLTSGLEIHRSSSELRALRCLFSCCYSLRSVFVFSVPGAIAGEMMKPPRFRSRVAQLHAAWPDFRRACRRRYLRASGPLPHRTVDQVTKCRVQRQEMDYDRMGDRVTSTRSSSATRQRRDQHFERHYPPETKWQAFGSSCRRRILRST